jgi:PAP2 superfamily
VRDVAGCRSVAIDTPASDRSIIRVADYTLFFGNQHMRALSGDLEKSSRREFLVTAGLSWLITIVTAAAAVLACVHANFKFSPTLIPLNLFAAFFALTVFVAYLFIASNFFILSVSNAVATISAFSSAGAVFSYAAMHYSRAFDLWDARLASTDELFYLDWVSLLRWADSHQLIASGLFYAYASFIPESVFVVIILAVLGQHRRLQLAMLAFQFSVLFCAVVAAFMPALGEYTYRKINTVDFEWLPPVATSYVTEVIQLRTDAPHIVLDNLEGVITFPSFHAALGVLLFWAFWRTPVVRWIALILNGALIVATPIFGGHYFVDVAAGILVGVASILVARGTVGFARSYIQRHAESD